LNKVVILIFKYRNIKEDLGVEESPRSNGSDPTKAFKGILAQGILNVKKNKNA